MQGTLKYQKKEVKMDWNHFILKVPVNFQNLKKKSLDLLHKNSKKTPEKPIEK